jgi:hypothetical protein
LSVEWLALFLGTLALLAVSAAICGVVAARRRADGLLLGGLFEPRTKRFVAPAQEWFFERAAVLVGRAKGRWSWWSNLWRKASRPEGKRLSPFVAKVGRLRRRASWLTRNTSPS